MICEAMTKALIFWCTWSPGWSVQTSIETSRQKNLCQLHSSLNQNILANEHQNWCLEYFQVYKYGSIFLWYCLLPPILSTLAGAINKVHKTQIGKDCNKQLCTPCLKLTSEDYLLLSFEVSAYFQGQAVSCREAICNVFHHVSFSRPCLGRPNELQGTHPRWVDLSLGILVCSPKKTLN